MLTAQGAAGNRRRGRGCRRRPRPGRARLWRSRLGRRRGPRRNCYLLRGIVCVFFSLVQPVTLTGAEAIVLVLHNRNDSGPAFRCWNPNIASFRCSLVAILVQVLTRLARVARIAIAARSRLQQIINLADIALLQWGSVVVKRLFRNVLQRSHRH